jgi:hypothetical protein
LLHLHASPLHLPPHPQSHNASTSAIFPTIFFPSYLMY